MALCAGATVAKAALYLVLYILMAGAVPSYTLAGPVLWLEILFNTVLAPFLFLLLKKFNPLLMGGRAG
jgi:rod shape-determining protein MreD